MSHQEDASLALQAAGDKLVIDALGMVSGAAVAVDEAMALVNQGIGGTAHASEIAGQCGGLQQAIEQLQGRLSHTANELYRLASERR